MAPALAEFKQGVAGQMLLVRRLPDLNLPPFELSCAVAAHDFTLLQVMFEQQLHHLNDMLPTAKVLLATVALCF